MPRIIKYLNNIIYWSIILIPFFMSIAPAPVSIFEGFLIISFLAKKALKKEPIFTKTAINIPLFFLFLITCLSVLNTINYSDSLRGGIFKLIRYILIFFIVVSELKDEKQIGRIVFSAAAGLILASFDGMWQIFTGKDFIRGYAPVINIGLVRATAAFKDSNTLGIYLSAIAPLIFGLSIYHFKKQKKALMWGLSLIALAGILLTYSRPTLLAIYIALLFLGIVKKDKAIIALFIILTLISPFILPKSVKNWAS